MQILEFRTKEKSSDGRSYLIAFPIDKIQKIESILGSQQVFCKVNGIEVLESYWDTKKILEDYNKSLIINIIMNKKYNKEILEEIFKKGKEAFMNGLMPEDNPYIGEKEAEKEWMEGYLYMDILESGDKD